MDEMSVRSSSPRSAQGGHDAVLVAGQLEVDVEADVEAGQVVEALLERRCRLDVVRVVVGQDEPAVSRLVWSSGRTSNSIMSTPASIAASKDASVLPGAIRSAPL